MTDSTADLLLRLEAALARLHEECATTGHPWLATLTLAKANEAHARLITLATQAARPEPRSGVRHG